MDDRTILKALRPATAAVDDPVSGQNVWLAGLVKQPRVEQGTLRFTLELTRRHTEQQAQALLHGIVGELRAAGVSVPVEADIAVPEASDDPVAGMGGPGTGAAGGPLERLSLPGVGHVVAVASGKGGVGKSTVATNLAVALARRGVRTGLVDADVHGPSAPTMFGLSGRPMIGADRRIIPQEAHGVRVLSMGMVVDADTPVIWRGPMVMGAVRQLFADADWSGTDVLVVDLPPGTGDAQLTLVQAVALAGAVIVTTPQEVALADAVRGIRMFRQLDVPLLGLVENMAYYPLDDGTKDFVFGEGGGQRMASAEDTEVLAVLPLRTSTREAGDAGQPVALGDSEAARAFLHVADRVAAQLGIALT